MLAHSIAPLFFIIRRSKRPRRKNPRMRWQKSGRFKREIVTQIEPAPKFFRAEEYHQRYLEKRGLSHCAI